MKKWHILLLTLLLGGCFEFSTSNKKDLSSEEIGQMDILLGHGSKPQFNCYDILPSKNDLRPILFNKCTGNSWMLVKVQLAAGEKPLQESWTYKWYKIEEGFGQVELSFK